MSRYLTRANLILAAIVLIAAFFRFYRLDTFPPGFEFDQAFNAFDVLRLLHGQFAIFFPANTGREPLYFYLMMTGVALFGPTSFALRLTSAIIGLLTIPLIFAFARDFFHSIRMAALTALFAAISFWHLFFSRDGLRVILEVPLTLLSFWFFWRALAVPGGQNIAGKKMPNREFLLTGIFLALALYTYPSARLLPLALIALAGFAIWQERDRASKVFKGLLLALLVAVIVCLPLVVYFLVYPDQFIAHTDSISIFSPRVNNGDVLGSLLKNTISILGMFFLAGDAGALRNLPGRPIFDPLMGGLFVVGVIVSLMALFKSRSDPLDRKRAVWLAVWLIVMLAASFFSDDAPNFLRTLPAFPAVMALPAWGVSILWDRLRALSPSQALQRVLVLLFVVMAGASAWSTFNDYFVVLANDPGTYYAFDVDKVEIANWITQSAPLTHLYLAPLTYQNGTISLLTRNVPLKSFESRDTIVLPGNADGKDALFAFPWEQDKKVQTMAVRLGALGSREELSGSNGGKLLLIYRVPAANLPDAQNPLDALARAGDFAKPQNTARAVWDDRLELLGSSIDATDSAKRNLEVTLFLRALKPIGEDYTFSVKARDSRDRTWGQEDKWTGDNSYNTLSWSPGDLVVEKFYPGLNACAPAGDYQVTVEVYNPNTSQVLGLSDRNSNLVTLGTVHADASPSNRLEDLEPGQTINKKLGDHLELIGYTLAPNVVSAGEPFSVSLFWRGVGQGSTEPLTVRVQDAAKHDATVNQSNVIIPIEGRGLCSFYDFTLPSGVQPGTATLWVNNSKIAEMTIK